MIHGATRPLPHDEEASRSVSNQAATKILYLMIALIIIFFFCSTIGMISSSIRTETEQTRRKKAPG